MKINVIRSILAILALSPIVQAVSPAPDGAYPGGNTAEGQSALLSLITGTYNTALGLFTLRSNTTGRFNTATGAGALLVNTADDNTATGAGALLSNSTATDNTANGAFALFYNTATGNTAIGSRALLNNTTGGTLDNINGFDLGPNVAVGWQALESNTVASANTAVGYRALHSFTSGPTGFEQVGQCTAVGFQTLANATGTGVSNSAFGYQALMNDTAGTINTANGCLALSGNITGDGNTADGFIALWHNTSGSYNTAIGANALGDNTTGSFNIALGYSAGQSHSTGDNNIYIGSGGFDESDTLRIGGPQTAAYIAGISGATVTVGSPVLIESGGKLGTLTSSQRFKEEIKQMDNLSERLFSLRPVSFRYKKAIDPAGTSQFGLVAEEVEKVNPDLVVHDKEGKPYSVRYDQVNAMLLNEFLKEHRKVEKLEATVAQQRNDFETSIAELKSEMDSLVARSKRQDARIQGVRTQIELDKPAPGMVVND